MIGAGSVVVKDIPDNVTAFGCPAKVKEMNNNILYSAVSKNVGGGKISYSHYVYCAALEKNVA